METRGLVISVVAAIPLLLTIVTHYLLYPTIREDRYKGDPNNYSFFNDPETYFAGVYIMELLAILYGITI